MARKKKARTPWEKAKPLLEQDIIDNRVKDHMLPAEVREIRTEYKQCGKTFGSNYRRLQKGIRKDRSRAFLDAAAFVNDKAKYGLAADMDEYWDGSEAQKLLAEDVKFGLHKLMKPKSLRLSRPEYRKFELEIFRGHIYQETRRNVETNYWLVKRKKKSTQYADEDEIDFSDPTLANPNDAANLNDAANPNANGDEAI